MSVARNLSKMINKENYITHSGHSSVSGLDMPTETSMVGMITSFSMTTDSDWRATNRWLICDGSAISRTTYSDLFLVVGTTWGVGDGSSTFNLPDLRGAFLRGIGDGSFSGRTKSGETTVGAFQEDQMQDHGHFASNFNGNVNDFAGGSTATYGWTQYNTVDYFRLVGGFHNAGGSNSNPNAGAEVRVYNAGIQFCIKY